MMIAGNEHLGVPRTDAFRAPQKGFFFRAFHIHLKIGDALLPHDFVKAHPFRDGFSRLRKIGHPPTLGSKGQRRRPAPNGLLMEGTFADLLGFHKGPQLLEVLRVRLYGVHMLIVTIRKGKELPQRVAVIGSKVHIAFPVGPGKKGQKIIPTLRDLFQIGQLPAEFVVKDIAKYAAALAVSKALIDRFKFCFMGKEPSWGYHRVIAK